MGSAERVDGMSVDKDEYERVVGSLVKFECDLRLIELQKQGKLSLVPNFDYETKLEYTIGLRVPDEYVKKLRDAYYPLAIQEAEDWVSRRNVFAIVKLNNGEHPDTHPEFWMTGKKPLPHPDIPLNSVFYSENRLIFSSF